MKRVDAIEQLCKILNLSDDALAIAEAWAVLPSPLQEHFSLLMNEYIARQHPLLREIYAGASRPDQERFNRIIEAAQNRIRGNSSQSE